MNSRARALMALAHLCTAEADEIDYRWPPASAEERAHAVHLHDVGDQAYRDAIALLGLSAPRRHRAREKAWLAFRAWWIGPDVSDPPTP